MATGLDDAFLGLKTHYGRFTGVHNAIALIGRVVRVGASDGTVPDGATAGVRGHDATTETATGCGPKSTPAIRRADCTSRWPPGWTTPSSG